MRNKIELTDEDYKKILEWIINKQNAKYHLTFSTQLALRHDSNGYWIGMQDTKQGQYTDEYTGKKYRTVRECFNFFHEYNRQNTTGHSIFADYIRKSPYALIVEMELD